MTPIMLGVLMTVGGLLAVVGQILVTRKSDALLWDRPRLKLLQRFVPLIAGLMVVMGVWTIGHAFNPSGPTRIPSPNATAAAAFDILYNGGLIDIMASSWRVLLGFSFAAFTSIILAIGVALHSTTASAFAPPISFIRYIPPTAFTALLVIYFGIDEDYKLAVIFVGVFFFNFRMTFDILEDFDTRYIELARLSGASYKRRHSIFWLFRTTVIPASMPKIWDMLRINMSFAWTFLVVAEVVGAQHGLGKELYLAQRFFRIEQVYACILLFGLIGLASDEIMAKAKRFLFKWHDDATRR